MPDRPERSTPIPPVAMRCRRSFYADDPATLACRLLGQTLVRILDDGSRLAGRIVEAEAYLGIPDRAAHSFGGRRTPRVEPMYGPPGTAYVYFTYGMHHCFNVVCGREGDPVAVLIRALEPIEGLRVMELRRKTTSSTGLCSGPARLCQALDLDRRHSGLDLVTSPQLYLEYTQPRTLPSRMLGNTARIGVDYAREWASKPLRWFILGNPHVSGRRSAAKRYRPNPEQVSAKS